MTDQTLNITLLRKAVEWAEAEAAKPFEVREWEQAAFRVLPEEFELEYANEPLMKSPDCGTCYCIAGYVTSLVSPKFETAALTGWAQDVAQDELGLTEEQSFRLFAAHNTIKDVREIAESIAGERL